MDRAVEIGVEWNPRLICDSCCMPITCGRNGRGPALDAGPHSSLSSSPIAITAPKPIQKRLSGTPGGRFWTRKGGRVWTQFDSADLRKTLLRPMITSYHIEWEWVKSG